MNRIEMSRLIKSKILLSLGILVLQVSVFADEPEATMSCSDFGKVFAYFQDQHLRFFIEPQTDRAKLASDALKRMPEELATLGFHFLSPQFEKYMLPKLSGLSIVGKESTDQLCEILANSLYRGVFLKSYARLLDPYSDFYLTEELDTKSSVVDGEFVGVGIATDPVQDFLEVSHVVEDGPAAGKILLGDKIYRVDGHPVKGLSEVEIRQRIRGLKGTKVIFGLKRKEADLDVEIIRDKVTQRSVTAEMTDNRFLMLKVHRFYRQTSFEVESAIRQAGPRLRGLILDLRNNPGGLLQAARDLVDLFISSGVVVYLRGRDVDEQIWAMTEGGYVNMPLVVLVNEGTASAAEIVAGALQDYGRALVIGHPTYGKGSVQNIYETQSALSTSYRGGFKLTTLFYYLPSGRNVASLKPDILSSAAEKSELEHPQMPYKGPSKIDVAQLPKQQGWQAHNRVEFATADQGAEEIGKFLILKMMAERKTASP